jgi:hypothetical protein
MDTTSQETPTIKDEIIRELKQCCRNLGAKSELLAVISEATGLDDKELLEELKDWNSHGRADYASMKGHRP